MDNLDCSTQTETGDEACGETGPLTHVAPSAEAWKKEKRPEKTIFQCAFVDQTEAKWPRSDQLELQRGPLATAPTPMNKLLGRVTEELAKGKARRAVPPWSIPREIWLMMLRPRDPDILETNRPTVTEADLNNTLFQTTSSKELLAVMREIREKQAANSEALIKSRRHLPSVPKPCGIGYQTRPPLMIRFRALISGLLGHIKGRGIAPDTWQRSAPVPLDKGTTKPGPARFRLVHLLCPFGKAFYGNLWRNRPNPCPRKVNTYAHSKGRRREAAILIQHMVRWRLTQEDVLAQIGTTMTGFDASNAFMSVHHTTLDKLVEASFEDEMDRSLMKQRYRWAQISLCPHVVFLQGDVTGPSFFIRRLQ